MSRTSTMDPEAAVRTMNVSWVDPSLGARAAHSMSGLAYMRAMLMGQVPHPPIAALMGMTLETVEEGRVVVIALPGEHHYNPIGLVHGGFTSTLLDSTTGCAVHTLLPQGTGYSTVDLHVTFVRPITVGTGTLRCEGSVVDLGHRMASAEGRLFDLAGNLLAHAVAICSLSRGESSR